jgi:hypothetical protein
MFFKVILLLGQYVKEILLEVFRKLYMFYNISVVDESTGHEPKFCKKHFMILLLASTQPIYNIKLQL